MPDGIRIEPIGGNAGAPSSRITSDRRPNAATQNTETQTQTRAHGVGGIEMTPENTEAIRNALRNAPIDILQKALRDADIEITQQTLDIVKSLINGSLPLTEQNIIDLLLQSHVFKDVPPDVLALMMRLEIPATPENVEQFENLITRGEKLSENLESLINKLPAEIFKGAQNLPQLSFLLNEIVKMIKGEQPQVQQRQPAQQSGGETARAANNTLNPAGNQGANPVLTRYELNSLLNMLRSFGAPNQVLNQIININRQNVEINAGNNNQAANNSENALETINKFIQDTTARVSQRPQDNAQLGRSFFENIRNMLESPAVQKLIKAEIQAKWVLTPQDLSGGSTELSRYYNGLNNNLHKFEQLLQLLNASTAQTAEDSSQLSAQTKDVRNNLTLMSEISKTMAFLQIPLRFSNDKIINSDLYIFNNKKRKSSSPVSSANAMIKLELENLGGVSIYVNIAGKNARAKFFSDNNEAVDEIMKNLPELDEAIYNLGFNFTSAAVHAEREQDFDILDDFINREVPKTEIRKYILRKRI